MLAPLTFESLTAAFLVALALASPATQASSRRRAQVALLCAAAAIGVVFASQAGPDLRGWLGHGYLVAGYWIPALLAPSRVHAGHFQSWLVRTDERCRRVLIGPPAWATPVLELSYLLCYVLVPTAFVLVWANGTIADVDRFWTAVLLSGFVCYGTLPWLVSRPPRVLDELAIPRSRLRSANEFVLRRMSHGLNTFPSGHVAVSLAAALEVSDVWRAPGIALTVVAAMIAAGAVIGRYHYVVDVLLGAAIGITISRLV
ncbi:MAG: phosphatase PAP2 family protein [Vicinamibacterales bacterium]